jgi:hypothetical protein
MSAYCAGPPNRHENVHSVKWQVDEVLDQRGHKLYPISALFAAVSRISLTSIARTSPSVAVSDSQRRRTMPDRGTRSTSANHVHHDHAVDPAGSSSPLADGELSAW